MVRHVVKEPHPLKYVPKGATKKKAKKASHMGEFILIMGLTLRCRATMERKDIPKMLFHETAKT
nr:hypothetical protein [uncultured Desulfobacter sp.]